jgi:ribosomal protein S27AE
MTKTKPKDYPLDECANAARNIIRDNPGALVFQKWTCAKCGERVTADHANVFTTLGLHSEREDGQKCGHVTNIASVGCNYMVHFQCMDADAFERAIKTIEGKR